MARHEQERDEYGRFTSDDDRSRGLRGRFDSSRGYEGRGNAWRTEQRDERGRFVSDDDRRYAEGSRQAGGYDDREWEQRPGIGGRFGREPERDSRDLYDNNSYGERDRDRYNSGYESRDLSSRRGDWDPRSDSTYGRRDEGYRYRDDRIGRTDNSRDRDFEQGMRRGYGDSRSMAPSGGRNEDFDNRRNRSYEQGDDRYRRDGDGRGWYGDSQGHSEASQRGWQHRR